MTGRRLAPPVPGGTICGRYPYAWRLGEQVQHLAIDFCAPKGTPIIAVLPGVAMRLRTTRLGGNNFIVKHADNLYTYYGHCDRILVREGEHVDQWQQVATVGQTGVTSRGTAIDPHLHWQVMRGVFEGHLDPLALLRELGIDEDHGVMVWRSGYPIVPQVNVAAVGIGIVAAAAAVFGSIWWARRRRGTHSMRPQRSRR